MTTSTSTSHPNSMPLEKNPNWNGGKTISSHGYAKIKRPDHPEADPNGYVYEHRLVAEKKLRRLLRKGEIVHHIDGNKRNNDPSNIEVCASIAHHKVLHRTAGRDRILPGQINPVIQCACGCGKEMKKYDDLGRARCYYEHHSFRKGTGKRNAVEIISCACGCGSTFNKYDKYGRARKYVSGHNGRK